LPGAGWNQRAKIHFQGKTEGGLTALERKGGTGEAHRLVIESRRMKVLDGSGAEAGRLERVIRKSPTVGQKPAEGALVLFDGKSGEHFRQARGGNSPPVSEDGLLRLVRGSGGLFTRKDFGSCRLHLEFRLPFEPAHSGQGRSNSGCYLQSRYEVQILDSFGLEGLHNECGGIYSSGAHPSVNMCFPPLSWQTYDIDFTAAQFDSAGKKIADARMTVLHNGVEVYTDQKIGHITTAAPEEGKPETADLKPHYLQDHGHEIHFRNIWIVER
ncbi:MAG: DUF1080 domain-containing protein, partial [Planctomycetes bacterium]|nr:DUF1080 domain-containing protein [Planctomycetota bacterium]